MVARRSRTQIVRTWVCVSGWRDGSTRGRGSRVLHGSRRPLTRTIAHNVRTSRLLGGFGQAQISSLYFAER